MAKPFLMGLEICVDGVMVVGLLGFSFGRQSLSLIVSLIFGGVHCVRLYEVVF